MKKLLLLFIIAAAAAAGYWRYNEERLQKAALTNELTLYGNVDIRDVSLGFRVAGRIASVSFEEGDRVRKGDVLALLDDQPFRDEVALYKAQLTEARVTRNKVEKPYLRRAQLSKLGAISKEERDDAQAARDEAQARVKAAEARLQQANTRLEDVRLLSPSDGIILTRVREPGAVVSPGETICSLALDRPVWVRAYVDEPNLGHVHPGQTALVLTDSGGRYEGRIGFISPQAEFTPKTVETASLRTDLVYRLRVVVDKPDQGLRQGMPVTVTLEKAAE